ncbi:3-methyl-2-oxobutanoate hydroxymethyltransferase [Cupriavidus plantarum]|uniref:3-methyl-2-oxobutanoate hydroxymethyltransferase n=1 Tax=Cupriavidus plantarum TaxID=942865 RepID=A0A316EWU9_9BURK|nr:3-methyl-2-oxobutanoate hydroxymethyltransferase [Cupriavidus plantarum]NYH99101.1 3-methyl-2-oxobutanoate hydroxymethyltransferase [Cupriavidus plantarum]PWK36325.1 ketopantoate hydroxymethyltransferase [Cupriavidus plantarum]REF02922.1 ketopantoate hydroxymethyltransferase [Cupriavidus plantarum]RLK44213.1 ketopantoate hydroxymethyltransferase [Cupriavidus plantarum]CAG2142019.1 3-methyl-2-oxobutanoate hydroxymethyltransferase [Cupriavidus plantarum]
MSYLLDPSRKTVTIPRLQAMRDAGEKIVMLTAYDSSFSALLDFCGVEVILVGDSLGNVMQGQQTTLPVTLAHMVYHTECVARGNQTALLMSDLPFGTYATPEMAYASAVELMRAGAQMVKIEGGEWLAPTVRFLVERSIPVCAHIGLTPQSVHALGGFKVQGKTDESAAQLKRDAVSLQDAGAQIVLMEAVPATLAATVTSLLKVPTIGIGAGVDCTGQVLVLQDMINVYPGRKAKFVRNFMEGQTSIEGAVRAYVAAVKDGSFPAPEHTFSV